jgi:uncharacterized protein YfaS (alpha-2-macroglobulin family)
MRIQALVVVWLAVIASGCGSKGPHDLKVDGSPVGEVTGKLKVIVTFSRAMVAQGQVGELTPLPPVTVEPSLPATAMWADDKTLVLLPAGNLPISTRYEVTVPKHTKALDGNELPDDVTFAFWTERLTGAFDVLGSPSHATRDQLVRLSFNQPVPLAQVTDHCRYTGGSEPVAVKNGPESPSGPARSYTLAPASQLTLDTDYVLACDTDLRGSVGNIGLEKPLEQKIHTYGPLHFVKILPSGKDVVPDENLPLKLVFTNPLKEPYQVKITPAVQGFPQQCHELDEDTPGLRCGVVLDAQANYTITIDASQQDAFGQTLGKTETLTFHTVDAAPSLSMETGYFIAELKRPVLPVWTRNVDEVEVTAVNITQENFHELRPLLSWWDNKPADFSKTHLAAKTQKIAITGTRNKWGQHPLGAAELFGGTPGPGMFYVELGSSQVKSDQLSDGGRNKVLVNFTDIGVVSKLSGSRGLVWATKLSTGKPLPGATVTVRDDTGRVKWSGTTDADGVALLPGVAQLTGGAKKPKEAGLDTEGEHYAQEKGGSDDLGSYRIFVQSASDWTMINPSRSNGLSAWNFNVSVDSDYAPVQLRGFMHTDRGLYRPGDTVHVKGLARQTRLGTPLDVPGEGKKVAVTVEGPQGKTFTTTTARLSPFGGFWFDLALPGDARLGDYEIHAQLDSGTFTREFTVEEYRPATYEVTGKMREAKLVRQGDLHGTITGSYYYGAPVRGAEVSVEVHSRTRDVSFAGYDGYDFADWRRSDGYYRESPDSQQLVTEDHITLDDKGNGALKISLTPNDVAHDADLLVSASVTAPNHETETKSFTVPYWAARTYFGIKRPDGFADVGTAQHLQIVAVGTDGKPMAAAAKLTVSRRDWNCVWEDWGYRGNYACKENTTTVLTKPLQIEAGKPADVDVTLATGGEYWVVVEPASAKQEAGSAATEIYAYGDGGGSWKSTDTMALDIVADKKEYKAGDTATLLLKTDLKEATGLVTIERDGVIEKHAIALTSKVKHIQVPITGNYAPNVYVSVALVQGRIGTGTRGQPRMRMGIIDLPVHPDDTKLAVSIETDKPTYRPGEQVTATVKVLDQTGAPVSSEVSITAADEGVLSLLGYQTPDPLPTFYASWGLGVTSATQLEYLRDIPGASEDRPAFGGDAVGTVRSHFVATAVWTPNAVTDATGTATIKFTAPDNLTAFRVMALAADRGHRFGSADKRFTVSKPLQLHEALPRFVNVADVVQGGVIVHNETGAPGTATVKVVLDSHLATGGPAERTVDVPAGGRVPVLWDLAARQLGQATLQFSVTMGDEHDAVELKLPVEQPSPPRVARIAASIAKTATKVPVKLPPHVLPGSAELVVSADPDGLAGIEEGLSDLVHYPYGCLEQTTSQMIPMIAARDLAESLAIDGLTGPALDRYINAGITKIGLHQSPYGGFSLWPGGDPDPYYTAYALWGLSLAKQAGYRVDQTRIDDGLQYLRNDGQTPDSSRPHYNDWGNRESQAFALYVRATLGDKAALADATKLAADTSNLPIFGKAFLARALAAGGLGPKDPAVTKLVAELSSLASVAWRTDSLIDEPQQRDLWWYMASSQRTTAVVLAALVELDPKNAAIPGLVQVIMKKRHGDGYDTTQADLYTLVALTAYARSVASAPASVTVTAGGAPLLAGALAGKQRVRVARLPLTGATELAITPTGEVHYSAEIHYRQTLDALVAESHGITLTQEYLDEKGHPKTSFKVGDVVRVRVKAELRADADHLMVSVALPAGLEAINSRFESNDAPGVAVQTTEWGTYSEIHDDRVDFASEYSSIGGYTHEFLARAVSPGKFVRPPTVAVLMYQPDVTARTAADWIEIKP